METKYKEILRLKEMDEDLLEIMGLMTEDEKKKANNTVLGYLTAENVFERIKRHFNEKAFRRGIRMDGVKKIYISGAVTGVELWRDIFNAKEKELKARYLGSFIVNPAVLTIKTDKQAMRAFGRKPTYNEYMARDLNYLCQCDCIYMLEGWSKSKGARLENYVAEILGLEIIGAEA